MDQTAKWMNSGEGLPPAQETGPGNLLGLSPRTAALTVMILLGLVLTGAYFLGFPANLYRAAAPAPYPHELARVNFAVGGDVIPHEPVRAAAEAAGGGETGWGSLLAEVSDVFEGAD